MPRILSSAGVLGGLFLAPLPLLSQPATPCRARASLDKLGEDRVLNSEEVQYSYAIRVVSSDSGCVRVTPTIAFTSRQPSPHGETKGSDEIFATEGPSIVTRGGVGAGRVTHQSPVRIVQARITSVACTPCEAEDELIPAKDGKGRNGPMLVFGGLAVAGAAAALLRNTTEDSFAGPWLGQLRMGTVRTFGVDCEIVASATYHLRLTLTREGESLGGGCFVRPTGVQPPQCTFAVPTESQTLRGTLRGSGFDATCGDPSSRAGVLSGAILTGTRAGDRISGTLRTPLGETGEWELQRQ